MRRGIGCAGLGCGIIGLSTGLFALFFDAFIYPSLSYDSPLNYLSTILWLCNTLFIGLAVCFVALGLMSGHEHEEADNSTATGQPASPQQPGQPVTTHYLGLAPVSTTPRASGPVLPPPINAPTPQPPSQPIADSSKTSTQPEQRASHAGAPTPASDSSPAAKSPATPADKPSPATTDADKPADTQSSSEPTERPREP